ncbi:hypothetical protein VCSRO91_2877 [Vibrio cholerae]|nr:hypothetical protein VCSRO91_2877 [Vibrio cholerae]
MMRKPFLKIDEQEEVTRGNKNKSFFIRPLERFSKDFSEGKISVSLIMAIFVNGIFKTPIFSAASAFMIMVFLFTEKPTWWIYVSLGLVISAYLVPVYLYIKAALKLKHT